MFGQIDAFVDMCLKQSIIMIIVVLFIIIIISPFPMPNCNVCIMSCF